MADLAQHDLDEALPTLQEAIAAVAVECADKGVTCNAICPTVVDTPFITSFLEHLQTATGNSYEETKIADLVVFLCSPAGQNMTGTAIPIDGGVTIA
uniref:Uncharacterized protein n=1 Tax=Magallana gigas TaxID=29159 RepID=K1PP07_MAGGI